MSIDRNNKPKKPLIYYYSVVILILMVVNFVLMPYIASRQIVEVDYGSFMTMIENKELDNVQIQDNQILFTTKESNTIYKTAPVNDPTLTERLYEAGVTFSGEIVETASPFQTILLNWILPMAIFIGIGQITSKKMMDRMGNGNDIMSFGM